MDTEKNSLVPMESSKFQMDSNQILELTPECQVFSIPELLKQVLQNFEDFETARLVCKNWKYEATPCLRENNWIARKFLVFSDPNDMIEYGLTFMPSMNGNPNNVLAALKEQEEQGTPIPHEELFFECLSFTFKLTLQYKIHKGIADTFFQVFPNSIKSLKIKTALTLVTNACILTKILKSQATSLKELKICVDWQTWKSEAIKKPTWSESDRIEDEGLMLVSLDYLCLEMNFQGEDFVVEVGDSTRKKWARELLEYFVKKIPQGKQVKICLKRWCDMNGMVKTLQKYDLIENLKILDIDGLEENGELSRLWESGVKLQSFSGHLWINVDGGNNTANVFALLCTQIENLEKLSWVSQWRFRFPEQPMIALKKLKLSSCQLGDEEGYEPSDDEVEWNGRCNPIYYDFFPKLEELHFEDDDEESSLTVDDFYTWVLPPQLPCTSVKKLTIMYTRLNSGILESISNTFTHLKCLHIGIFPLQSKIEEKAFFETLWGAQFGSTLEELSIRLCRSFFRPGHEEFLGRFWMDSLFSGVTEETIEMITSNYNQICQPQGPSILNFKNLRTLEIKDWYRFRSRIGWDGFFTNFSAYCVFGKLEKLSYFYLPRNLWEFTKGACVHLRSKLRSQQRILHQGSSEERLEDEFGTSFDHVSRSWEVEGPDFCELELDEMMNKLVEI